jgi:mono/diheme cytochrome c family protein
MSYLSGWLLLGALNLSASAADRVDYARDVRPILAKSCYGCHGADKQKSGLRLDRRTEALAGGDSGKVIEPGRSANSLLIDRVTADDPDQVMPPKGERLTPEEVDRLRVWIDQGASWPDDAGGPVGSSSSVVHWAFRRPERSQPPAVEHRAWLRNPIDSFVLAKLEALGVAPSPEADRPTLVRRLSLDLIGLPPTPQEVEDYLRDSREDAYERLVDRLLASPHFGERWGRHWLDLARYADSDGYEKDSPRPYAWRYRQWVIEAHNRDLSFDEFTAHQLAGDLVPGLTSEQKSAMGFHRNTLTNREGGVDQEEFRVKAVVDRVNTTGTVWLGLTVGCAQCHTHKYDPITQREYYGLFAFFNTSDELDLPAPLPGESESFDKARDAHREMHARLVSELKAYDDVERPARQAEWERTEPSNLPIDVQGFFLCDATTRTPSQATRLSEYHRSIDPEYRKRYDALIAHAKTAPKLPASIVPALAESRSPRRTHILLRGDFLRKGEEVVPVVPAVLHRLSANGATPTRLDLAHWLMDPANPLTARVTVNRMWGHLFGRPLVPSADDFGTRGEPPSHPELLDWLALELPALGWSQKAMVRLIVTSAAYRQLSVVRPDLEERDPNNVWIARQGRRRLEAEILRDAALAVSGLLDHRIGGPSVRPPQPPGISDLTYAGSAKWVESQGPDRNRRGMYTWFQRTSPYPMLVAFDAPDGNVCVVKRERSNTPLQALTLLNDTVFFECARALGERIANGPCRDVDARLRLAFRLCLARQPTSEEMSALVRVYTDLSSEFHAVGGEGAERAAWTAIGRVLLNLDEFVSRE